VNNNQFGALHFINAPYKIGDRTDDKKSDRHSPKIAPSQSDRPWRSYAKQ
jgi:hypothetical protein